MSPNVYLLSYSLYNVSLNQSHELGEHGVDGLVNGENQTSTHLTAIITDHDTRSTLSARQTSRIL